MVASARRVTPYRRSMSMMRSWSGSEKLFTNAIWSGCLVPSNWVVNSSSRLKLYSAPRFDGFFLKSVLPSSDRMPPAIRP